MAQSGFPRPRVVALGLVVVALAYAVTLLLWMRGSPAYARLVTRVATGVVFPLTGAAGSVQSANDGSLTLTYVLPYPSTGGWGAVKQRLFHVPDMPLATALTLGLLFLGWKRRLAVLLGSLGTLFLIHSALVVITARRLSRILEDPSIPASHLDAELHGAAEAVGAYRDLAPVVTLVIVGVWAATVMGRRWTGELGSMRRRAPR